ncbi:hypothetical protein G7046_g4213 [Stylonectria norvegica]|nr:hypothetical protein G7046_g4213 [Stylonectria norvegica]
MNYSSTKDQVLRKGIPENGAPYVGPGFSVAAASNGKYHIYSSKAVPEGGDDTQILTPQTNIDNFVTLLPTEQLVLKAAPTADNLVGEFDESDGFAKWMTNLDDKGAITLNFDSIAAKNVESFDFHLTKPWNITFSSIASVLLFSFGPQTAVPNSRIPSPGLMPEGTLLYFGLDPKRTKDLKSTIKGLFDFAGVISSPPSILANWEVELEIDDANSNHNALWFAPADFFQTTVRLQFSLLGAYKDKFQTIIAEALSGFSFESVDAICKKTLILAETEAGQQALDNGQVMLQAKCSVTPPNHPKVDMLAGVEFFGSSYSLSLQLDTPDALSGILIWLGSLVPGGGIDLSFIEDILSKDKIFSNVFLRRINVELDGKPPGDKTTLSSFSVDIEVKAAFGKASGTSKPVVFLLTYTWAKDGPRWGTIRGDLWNWFDNSPIRDLSPNYEIIANLLPLTADPASTLDLVNMIPNQTVENIPRNIPTEISRAYIMLSNDNFAIGCTIQSKAVQTTEQDLVPQLDLGIISIDGSYSWGKSSNFQLNVGVMAQMRPSVDSKHQDTAILTGTLSYSSAAKTWELKASLAALYASTLYEFFDSASADHVMPLIESIEIKRLDLVYKYTGKTEGADAGKSVGSYFVFEGVLLVAALELAVHFEYKDKAWTFVATLKASDDKATLGDILESILGDDNLDLPDFLADTPFNGDGKDALSIEVKKGPKVQAAASKSASDVVPGGGKSFQFVAALNIGPLELHFAQIHGETWPSKAPSKRIFKVALTKLPEVPIPLVGSLAQPFDEMYYMWIQDSSNQNKTKIAGLTREEIDELDPSMGQHPLVAKDKFKAKTVDDVLMSAGSHFAIIIKDSNGVRTCILDYDFKKQAPSQPPKKSSSQAVVVAASKKGTEKQPEKPESDGNSSSAPFKTKAGPLSISNIGLKYSDKTLHVRFDATFELGPIGFSLLGFSIDLEITSLDFSKMKFPGFSLEGFAVSFEKPPLTLAGIVRHGNNPGLDYYAGGLIVGWVPYQLEAAGFYGEATKGKKDNATTQDNDEPKKEDTFTSVFVFARLDGPLLTLEFAELSGVTGGFGYKSEVRIPTADQITSFPFIDQDQLSGATGSALDALEKLTSPELGGWFRPLDDTYWAAAGMKIDAFQMISMDAVVVVQFGQSIKLGIFAVALVDIPTAKAGKLKFAHVELGIAVVVDFDYGTMKAEAQLSPKSYILDPNCHLTGGFALYYWFDAPHADRSNIGNFVFTLGGYHQAFEVPEGWPNPPRLGISWSLGSNLSISGEAYFAITPKVCMGGGKLHAAFHAGPISAWFDTFANFLINYQPFFFTASAGICVGVSFNLDVLFIHTHISAEVSADLYLWGPPLAGRVHVDIKVAKFNINFGASKSDAPALSLLEFYNLVLQVSSQGEKKSAAVQEAQTGFVAEIEEDELDADTQSLNEGHTFLAQSGLMNEGDSPSRKQNDDWIVRGGTFSFSIGCKMTIDRAEQVDEKGNELNFKDSNTNEIFAKPMKITDPLHSDLKVSITQEGVALNETTWRMSQEYKSVPTGLWEKYDGRTDPSGGSNNIDELLDNDHGGVQLMTGVLMMAPPAVMSKDHLPKFNIEDAELVELDAKRFFPKPKPSNPDFEPDMPDTGPAQWKAVHDKWMTPRWNSEKSDDAQGGENEDVQTAFVSKWAEVFNWDSALSGLAKMPTNFSKRFNSIYIAAPLMTK